MNNALGAVVTFPGAVWGHNPVHYYEVKDKIGETKIIANPLEAGDQFSMQFDSLEALLRWKQRNEKPVMVTDRPSGPDTGIGSLMSPRQRSNREITESVGYFNLRRAISFADWQGMGSIVDFMMPKGMAWMESLSGGGRLPLSITAVSEPFLFGTARSDAVEDEGDNDKLKDILDPDQLAQRLDLASKPEPTILVILGVLAAFFLVAVLRINYQLHR